MPRPATKSELIEAANSQFTKLWELVDSMSEEERNAEFAFDDRDRNVRDVLVHLYEWHTMMESWYRVGVVEGGIPKVPAEGYNWKTYPALNVEIWKKYQGTPLKEAEELLKGSHARIMELIEPRSNDELFTKGFYKWTKTSTLGSYFVSSTSSHYDWAMKKIKKHIKSYRSE